MTLELVIVKLMKILKKRQKCEEMVALALKCEYQGDEGACSELNSLEPPKSRKFCS